MKTVILCGGKGTRLRPYTHTVPKPMLLLGRKPIIQYTIENLKKQGFTDLILNVGHLKEQFMDYFKDGKEFGVKIQYSVEDQELGDAGSVKNCEKLIDSEHFMLVMADQLTKVDYRKVAEFHKKQGTLATAAFKMMGMPMQFGVAEIDKNSLVTEFKEKPIIENRINAAIYAFSKKALQHFPVKGGISVDVLPKLIKQKQLTGYTFSDYWVDLGSIHDYEHVNQIVSISDLINGD